MKCIIVDDEPIARRGLQRLVGKYENLELLATFGSAKQALVFLNENEVDLIFLDIKMDGLNGMEMAKIIKGQSLVIFTTAYSQFAVESYNVNAIDYLIKPVNRERFGKAIEKALNYHQLLKNTDSDIDVIKATHNYLIVKSERKYLRLKISDILYIEGLKDYVIIHLGESHCITHLTLKAILNKLPDTLFIRISKSFAVNKDMVNSFDNNDVHVGGYILPVGAAYRNDALTRLLS